MEEIVKIIGIGMVSVIVIIIIKQYRPEFATYISIITGVIILLLVMDKLEGIIRLIQSISTKTNINEQFLTILIKITGIALLAEFAVSICRDSGESAIANKIELGSKVIIISMSIPIITCLLEVMINILP